MAHQSEIHTARLVLRTPVQSDAERITELMQEKDIAWNLGRAPYPYAISDAEDWIASILDKRENDLEYSFVLTHPDDGLIGCAGVTRHDDVWELGYWVGKPYWGMGYTTEATTGVMDWARARLGATQFMAGHYIENPASGAVLIKLGFEPVGVVEHFFGKARGQTSPARRYVYGAPADTALNMGLQNGAHGEKSHHH